MNTTQSLQSLVGRHKGISRYWDNSVVNLSSRGNTTCTPHPTMLIPRSRSDIRESSVLCCWTTTLWDDLSQNVNELRHDKCLFLLLMRYPFSKKIQKWSGGSTWQREQDLGYLNCFKLGWKKSLESLFLLINRHGSPGIYLISLPLSTDSLENCLGSSQSWVRSL